MASFFLRIKPSNETKASAHMRADYINREGKYAEGTKAEELVYKDTGNMPAWAKSNPRKFWEESEYYETKAGRLSYREITFALPNELTFEQQKEFTKEFLDRHFGNQFVYSYAIHEKAAALAYGVQNPHVHVIFSERRLDEIERNASTFFKRADYKNPERGGAPKDARWNGSDRSGYLRYMREDCAALQNKYLEREGFTERVDHRTKDLMYLDAIKNGDLDKAEMLEIPKEKHLGPKLASKVSRDLKMLTAGVNNPKERSRIRAQYLKSLEDNKLSKVALMFETRTLKHGIIKRNEVDTSRKEKRVTFVDKFAENMYWRAQKAEAKSMCKRLELERYRLERAEKNAKTNKKVVYWRGHYERRLSEYETLKNNIDNRIVTTVAEAEIEKIKQAILSKEGNDQSLPVFTSRKELLRQLDPDISQKEIKQYALHRIDHINKQLALLKKEEKALSRKLRTEIQLKAIVEWRISKGLLQSIYRDQKHLEQQKCEFKRAMLEFGTRQVPEKNILWKHDLELARLHDWEDAIKDLSESISSRRLGWEIQKRKPDTQKEIGLLLTKFDKRNDKIAARLKEIKDLKFKLYQERSEWRKLSYSINRAGESGQFLRAAKEAYNNLRQAVSKLREARVKGRLGNSVKLRFDEDYTRPSVQEYEN